MSMAFAQTFRFKSLVNKVEIPLSKVGELEAVIERHGNLLVKPFVIESAPSRRESLGSVSLAKLLKLRGGTFRLDELDSNGGVIRSLVFKKCRFKRYQCVAHDASLNDVVIEKLTIHPRSMTVLPA